MSYEVYVEHPAWFIRGEPEKTLHLTHRSPRSDALSPCVMGPEDVDVEMSFPKHPRVLEICGMTQAGLEHFVTHYGKEYEFISLFKCQLINDFSPLEDLPRLKGVSIYWNIRADRFWDLSRNPELEYLNVDSAKKLTRTLTGLSAGQSLRFFRVSGDMDTPYPLASMSAFAGLAHLDELRLQDVKPIDKNMSFLDTLPLLDTIDFDAGMLTFEELARLSAKYPHLSGPVMGPYQKYSPTSREVRVNGYRKPTLHLPEQQAALDRYVAQFNTLAAQYRAEQNGTAG